MFFADEAPETETAEVQAVDESSSAAVSQASVTVNPVSGDELTMIRLASFMVDSFWLNSPQQLVVGGDGLAVRDRSGLIGTQAEDLQDKYGERMGKRMLESSLIEATDSESGQTLGAVGIEVCLLDKIRQELLSADRSEAILKNAVASLGPKQRRQYKNSSPRDIAAQLMPSEFSAVVSLSNLAVSPLARRRGVAKQLCETAERVAASEWGFPDIYLKVEEDNTAARALYEGKLGYQIIYALENRPGLRVDTESESFSEIAVNLLIMSKPI